MPVETPAPPRRTQAERRAETRAALLDAALDLLVAVGLAGFTTTEVAKRAELSQGALFKHFPTKATLLAAVIEHLFDALRDDFEGRFAALDPAERSPRVGVDLLWDQMLDERLAAAFEMYAAARTDGELRVALDPVVAAHVERIHELAAVALPDVDPAARLATVELALLSMQGMVLQQMAVPDVAQEQRLRELLDGLAVALLGAADQGEG